jgi:hypothetical protein
MSVSGIDVFVFRSHSSGSELMLQARAGREAGIGAVEFLWVNEYDLRA